MTKYFIILLSCCMFAFIASCTKKSEDTGKKDSSTVTDKQTGEKTGQESSSTDKQQQTAVSDTVFFGQWNGKKIIIEDNNKFSENEKLMTEKEGKDYSAYGERLKSIIKKYQKFDEQIGEYYFPDYKDEFAAYTSLKPGRKMYVSTVNGVYPVEINGYYISLDDMIGSGAIFYATADAPKGVNFGEREVMVCSYNSNMTKSDTNGVNDNGITDKIKESIMPKLSGITVTEYDDKGKEKKRKLDKLSGDDIKIIKGSFTGAGKNEFLAGVRVNNDPTNFSSGTWIMDADGKIIKEFVPLLIKNFTYSTPVMIVDFNGDGVWEIITNDGYYEGGGYNFHKFTDGKFKVLTAGFNFGV